MEEGWHRRGRGVRRIYPGAAQAGCHGESYLSASMLPVLRVPLIGRQRELTALGAALQRARTGEGSVHILTGEGGVGKTRIAESVIERARELGFLAVVSRSYPVETGIPYALFGDGFVPLLREMSPAALQTISRGATAELSLLFPTLRTESSARLSGDSADLKPRLLDAFAQLLHRLADKQPLLLVLENLHWADPSSLDLFHFVARTAAQHPLMVLASYNEVHREENRSLRLVEQSLHSLGVLAKHPVKALTRAESGAMVSAIFSESPETVGDFAERVHDRTRGNPFFIEETLKALVRAGRLRKEGEHWVGWSTQQLSLPDSIRDALSLRYDRMSESAQQIVQIAAAAGAQVSHALLRKLAGLGEPDLLGAIDELLKERVFEEVDGPAGAAYSFNHPLLQEMLYAELARARVSALHGQIAEAMESLYGEHALDRAEELAVHFGRAGLPELTPRAIRYLTAAGRMALARGAAREAAESLAAALALVEGSGDVGALEEVLELLGRARHRLGDYAGASVLWRRAVALASARGALTLVASLERRLGVAALRLGDLPAARVHLDQGLRAAESANDSARTASLHLARSTLFMESGEGAEAEREGMLALALAESEGDPALLARVHQALQGLTVWRGPSERVAEHASRALAFATTAGDAQTAWQTEWVSAYHAGLTGDAAGTAARLAEASRIAEDLRSPLLRLWTAEVAIEYRSGIGEWSAALDLGDRTIADARAFGQRRLLPRLLVWTSLIHCGRGDLELAKARIDEAWMLSGADRLAEGLPVNLHAVVPAHVGLGYYHLYRRDFRAALAVGERGLELADRSGYEVLAVHRLLPLLAEASLWLGDWERSERYGNRMREASDRLGHPLARAWADACVALQRMLQGDVADALTQLREAADALEAIPFVEHAARLRRRLADALIKAGDIPAARDELRRVHDVFQRLGARLAVDDVRERLRDIGDKPPKRVSTVGAGFGALTPREFEIAKLIGQRLSNAAIGRSLGISARTVGTHLANIFKKVDVDNSRVKLGDLVRELGLMQPESPATL